MYFCMEDKCSGLSFPPGRLAGGGETLEEKIDLLAGYQDFYLHPCERLGIPAFKLADGPLGLASWGLFGKATAFPSALSLAASWNRDLAARVGDCYGQEWRARGIHFLLAPGVNTYRASKGARNFEYMGEDPYLSSEMVVRKCPSVRCERYTCRHLRQQCKRRG